MSDPKIATSDNSSPSLRDEDPPTASKGHISAAQSTNLYGHDTAYLPGGEKSLSGISIRAFCLGIALGVSLGLTARLALLENDLWRAPFFITVLAVFHYLEFDATARHNPTDAKVSSFLLDANGSAYNIAHTAALIELLVRSWLRSTFCPERLRCQIWLTRPWPLMKPEISIIIGLFLIVLGQTVRTTAITTAARSFNHIVQSKKREDHILITHGIYHFLRHPSYFGFFWWALGTQIRAGKSSLSTSICRNFVEVFCP